MNIKKAVVKVGTSTLTHDSGLMNFRRIERLARTLSDIKNYGTEVIFV
jgi:glutamate 5-kinase